MDSYGNPSWECDDCEKAEQFASCRDAASGPDIEASVSSGQACACGRLARPTTRRSRLHSHWARSLSTPGVAPLSTWKMLPTQQKAGAPGGWSARRLTCKTNNARATTQHAEPYEEV